MVNVGKNLDSIIRRASEVSTIPQVALRVAEISENEDATLSDVKDVLESDAPLSARVMRYVNSSAIGLRTKVTNLRSAISYLGMRQIRNLAIEASVCELFKSRDKLGDYTRAGLWRHSMAVAVCSQKIAMRQQIVNFEDAFLAGLLHDIGIILEDQYSHKEFEQMLGSPNFGKGSLVEAERECLGYDHAMLGEAVAENWKLPPAVRASIAYHHSSGLYHGSETMIVACVEVANMICSFQGWTSIGVNLVVAKKDAIEKLDLSADDVEILSADTLAELDKRQDLLTL